MSAACGQGQHAAAGDVDEQMLAMPVGGLECLPPEPTAKLPDERPGQPVSLDLSKAFP
jgi:hypothetical protein